MLFLFEKLVRKKTDLQFKDQQKAEEYVASALTWAFTLINPFRKYKYLEKFSGLILVVGKHITKLFRKTFDLSDFLVDVVMALLSAIVSFAIDKKLREPLKIPEDIE